MTKIPLKDKPGANNWLEKNGNTGLPNYIKRIAEHIKGDNPSWSDGRCIASAVNTAKRWCSGGSVSKTSGPKASNVSAATKAKACRAVAQWEAAKAKARLNAGGGPKWTDETMVLYLTQPRQLDDTEYFLQLAQARGKKIPSVVRRGQRGNTVRAVQERLSQLGYDISVDGEFGFETERALRDFQKDHQKLSDGVVGPKTLSALLAANKRKESDTGAADIAVDATRKTQGENVKVDSKRSPMGRGLGDARAAQRGSGKDKSKDKEPEVDEKTGKLVGTKDNPIGSTKINTPGSASWDESKYKRGAGGQFISKGSSGESVRSTQQELNTVGAQPQIAVDGEFGNQTDSAVRRFQRANGLVVDGRVGAKTRKALKKRAALLRASGTKFNDG